MTIPGISPWDSSENLAAYLSIHLSLPATELDSEFLSYLAGEWRSFLKFSETTSQWRWGIQGKCCIQNKVVEICSVLLIKPLRTEAPQILETTSSTAWLSSQEKIFSSHPAKTFPGLFYDCCLSFVMYLSKKPGFDALHTATAEHLLGLPKAVSSPG